MALGVHHSSTVGFCFLQNKVQRDYLQLGSRQQVDSASQITHLNFPRAPISGTQQVSSPVKSVSPGGPPTYTAETENLPVSVTSQTPHH